MPEFLGSESIIVQPEVGVISLMLGPGGHSLRTHDGI